MKQAEYNEIATLLRELGRQREQPLESASGADAPDFAVGGAHLDADELSSYAERALPPLARARCTAHLADCDYCRQIVSQLSLAAGPLPAEPGVAKEPLVGATWTEKLSRLFSLQVIRYAMPALALIIAAVAFYGWRQRQADERPNLVAQQSPAAAAPRHSDPANASSGVSINKTEREAVKADETEGKEIPKKEKSAPQATPEGEPKPAIAADKSVAKKPEAPSDDSVSAPADGKKEGRAASKAGEPAYAPEPPAPAQANSANAATQDQKDRNNTSEEQERGRDAVAQQRKGPARNEVDGQYARGAGKRQEQQQQPASKAKAAGAVSTSGARADEDEAETRTLFGRNFRRLNRAWVDTAYKSSMSVRSLTRGTEEYRALVADEPEVGAIGKQLSGEVIVVWKGRAYRIY